MENKYLDKIGKTGFNIFRFVVSTEDNKKTWYVQQYIVGGNEQYRWKLLKAYSKRVEAEDYYNSLLTNPLNISDSITRYDREKLLNKGFTFYRLRADNSIWCMNKDLRDWKQLLRYTSEDQANKEFAALLEDYLAIEV